MANSKRLNCLRHARDSECLWQGSRAPITTIESILQSRESGSACGISNLVCQPLLEGSESSNPPLSTPQSLSFRTSRRIDRNPCVCAICDHVWTQRATAAGFASRSTKIASAFGSGFEWHSPKNAADKAARAGIGLYDIAAFQCGFERRHFLTTVDLGERTRTSKITGLAKLPGDQPRRFWSAGSTARLTARGEISCCARKVKCARVAVRTRFRRFDRPP